ncbi:thioredoxin family protein [Desulfosoma sp.]|uniref:thioredoxin family protein n=1 Tax=Desulfosoma sp. TaxID=2603217 RepID=UPI00404A5A07
MPLNEYDRRALLSWNAHVSGQVCLRLCLTRDPRSAALQTYAEDLRALSPHISLHTAFEDTDDLPGFFIDDSWIWHAVPSGAELRPFLETLALFQEMSAALRRYREDRLAPTLGPIRPDLRQRLLGLQSHRELLVFTAPQCPQCAHMLLELAPMPFITPYLMVRVVDALLCAERAQAAGIRSVPTILFGEDFRWTGRVNLAHVLEVVCRNESTELSAAAAIRLLKEGKAQELSRLMLSSSNPWRDFPAVLTRAEWSVRLGALVVLEELVDKDPLKAQAYLPLLWNNMDELPAAVQGDVVYATGIVGDPAWTERVFRWAEKQVEDSELREVGEETLNTLKRKKKP